MIPFILAEVAVPPEVIEPAAGLIEAALGGLVGAIARAIPWWKDTLVAAFKWWAHLEWSAVGTVWTFAKDVNIGVSAVRAWASAEIQGLVRAVSAIHPSTVVNVTNTVAANLDQVYRTIDGAENYAISVSEDLYNRTEARIGYVQDYLFHTAWGWVLSAEANAQQWIGDLRSYVGDLHNLTWGHIDQVERDVFDTVQQSSAAVVGYVDGAVGQIERDLGGIRPWVNGALTVAGAELFAKVITTVKDLYDPCCEFTTDQVKPQWGKVKNLLGKLTRRGPLALVVLGAASEAVVALDRPTIVAMLKQARADDKGQSLAVLNDWRRPGVA